MGAKQNLPSLKNAVMDSPDQENFNGGVGVVVVGGGKQFLIVLMSVHDIRVFFLAFLEVFL